MMIPLLLLSLMMPVYTYGQSVTFTMQSDTCAPGDDINLAVSTTNTTGMSILSIQFEVTFDGANLTANLASTAGTIASGWTLASYASNGKMNISMASASVLSDSGDLVIVNFSVSDLAIPGSAIDIQINNISINEGSVSAASQSGVLTIEDSAPVENVILSVGNGSADPSQSDTVPVTISDVTSLNLTAAEFTVNFDASLLEVTSVSTSGTLAASWSVAYNVINNALLVSLSGATALNGSGVLVNIEFKVKSTASTGQDVPLDIDAISLNEGQIPSEGEDGIFSITGGISADPVELSVPAQTEGSPGGSVSIPVRIQNGIDKNLIAISFDVEFDDAILSATNVSINGSVVSGWSLSYNIDTDRIRIAIAGVTTLGSDGMIVTAEFDVNQQAVSGSSSHLNITNVLLNEGNIPFNVENGVVNISSTIKIGGLVQYFKGNTGVENVNLALTGETALSMNSQANGSYEFNALNTGDYTITPSKSGDKNGAVSHYDASLILQNYVGTLSFTSLEAMAADVSGDGNATAFDAALILQYVVGIITSFPAGTDWIFVPDSYSYTGLSSNVTNADFTGIVIGDPSGNWSPVTPVVAKVTQNAVLCLPDTVLAENDTIVWPIKISGLNAVSIYSFGFELHYNTSLLELINVSNNNTLTSSWGNPTAYSSTPGIMTVAMAGAVPINNDGDLLLLELAVNAQPGISTDMVFQNVLFNEGEPAVTAMDGTVALNKAPEVFELTEPLNQSDVLSLPLDLIWEEASDSQGDSVIYSIHLSKNLFDLDASLIGTTNQLSYTLTTLDSNATYYWKVIATDKFGAETSSSSAFMFNTSLNTGIDSDQFNVKPEKFALHRNYPNPFNPSTHVIFSVPEKSDISIMVYDVNGKMVDCLYKGFFNAGQYDRVWDASNFAAGVYFVRMSAEKFQKSMKVLLVK